MSDANSKAGVKPMPVTGGCCGIRPSKEAMEVDFEVDFSQAKALLEQSRPDESSDHSGPSQSNKSAHKAS